MDDFATVVGISEGVVFELCCRVIAWVDLVSDDSPDKYHKRDGYQKGDDVDGLVPGSFYNPSFNEVA